MKITAIAHPIQGLIKYHGLKDPIKRLPFHDSISVCEGALTSTTTVESKPSIIRDTYRINGTQASAKEAERIRVVLDDMRRKGKVKNRVKVESKNTLTDAKGVGFSASGLAALGFAANEALEANLSNKELSESVRLGAGSATRSLAGGFSIWYASRAGDSYADRLACPNENSFRMLIAPLSSTMKTDQAHREVLTSPFFQARVRTMSGRVREMLSAVKSGDLSKIGELAEADTLSLHAVTMTGSTGMLFWEPKTLELMKTVQRLREEEGVSCWFSIDTGPSVFINTDVNHVAAAKAELSGIVSVLLESRVGGAPRTIEDHLF